MADPIRNSGRVLVNGEEVDFETLPPDVKERVLHIRALGESLASAAMSMSNGPGEAVDAMVAAISALAGLTKRPRAMMLLAADKATRIANVMPLPPPESVS